MKNMCIVLWFLAIGMGNIAAAFGQERLTAIEANVKALAPLGFTGFSIDNNCPVANNTFMSLRFGSNDSSRVVTHYFLTSPYPIREPELRSASRRASVDLAWNWEREADNAKEWAGLVMPISIPMRSIQTEIEVRASASHPNGSRWYAWMAIFSVSVAELENLYTQAGIGESLFFEVFTEDAVELLYRELATRIPACCTLAVYHVGRSDTTGASYINTLADRLVDSGFAVLHQSNLAPVYLERLERMFQAKDRETETQAAAELDVRFILMGEMRETPGRWAWVKVWDIEADRNLIDVLVGF